MRDEAISRVPQDIDTQLKSLHNITQSNKELILRMEQQISDRVRSETFIEEMKNKVDNKIYW